MAKTLPFLFAALVLSRGTRAGGDFDVHSSTEAVHSSTATGRGLPGGPATIPEEDKSRRPTRDATPGRPQ